MKSILKCFGLVALLALGANAWADAVAKIGTTEYATLEEAFSAVKATETVVLLCDLDFAGRTWTPVDLRGSFDGQGHKISNLTISLPEQGNVGFFSKFRDQEGVGKKICNIVFENADIKGAYAVAVVVGGNSEGTISNVTVRGSIKVEGVGGYGANGYGGVGVIVGYWGYMKLIDVTVDGLDKAASYVKSGGRDGRYVGGLVGHADDVVLYENCTVRNLRVMGGWLCGGMSGPGPADGVCRNCTIESVDIVCDYSGGLFGWFFDNNGARDNKGVLDGITIRSVTFERPTKCGTVGGYSMDDNVVVKNLTVENVNEQGLYHYVSFVTVDEDDYFYSTIQLAIDNAATLEAITVRDASAVVPDGYELYEKGALWGVREKAGAVAQIGDDKYATLAEAIAAAGGDLSKIVIVDANPTALEIPAGYKLVDLDNGQYGVAAVVYVAEVSDGAAATNFETLQAAFDAARNGETVKLLVDVVSAVNETFTVAADKSITFDLNGKVLSGRYDKTTGFAYLTNNGTLTLKDGSAEGTGRITSRTDPETGNLSGFYTVLNKGVFVMESGTIEEASATVGGGSNLKWAFRNEASQGQTVAATIKGGMIVANYNAISDYVYDDSSDCTLNVVGGVIKSTGRFSVVTLQNAAASRPKFHINVSGGEFIVENRINTNPNGNAIFYCDDQTNAGADFTGCFKITGGKFNTFNKELIVDYDTVSPSSPAPTHDTGYMTAGVSKCVIPEESIADGYACVPNADEVYLWRIGVAHPEVKVVVPEDVPVTTEGGEEVPEAVQEAAATVVTATKEAIAGNTAAVEVADTGLGKAIFAPGADGEEAKVAKTEIMDGLKAAVNADTTLTSAEKAKALEQIANSEIDGYVDVRLDGTAVSVVLPTQEVEAKVTLTTITYEVQPISAVTVVTKDGEGKVIGSNTVEKVITNEQLARDNVTVSFRLPLTDDFTKNALVQHEGDPDRIVKVLGAPGGRYIALEATHFSPFKISKTDEEVPVEVEVEEILGIIRHTGGVKGRSAGEAKEYAVGVPWLGREADGTVQTGVTVDKLIVKNGLAVGDELSVWRPDQATTLNSINLGTKTVGNAAGSYAVYRWDGTKWIGVRDADTGLAAPDAATTVVDRGAAVWYKRAAGADNDFLLAGLVSNHCVSAVSPGAKTKPVMSLMTNPYPEDVDVNKFTGMVAGDEIVRFESDGTKKTFTYNGTAWGVYASTPGPFGPMTSFTPVAEAIVIAAGQNFWYVSRGGAAGAPKIDWKAAKADVQ